MTEADHTADASWPCPHCGRALTEFGDHVTFTDASACPSNGADR